MSQILYRGIPINAPSQVRFRSPEEQPLYRGAPVRPVLRKRQGTQESKLSYRGVHWLVLTGVSALPIVLV